MQTHFEKEISNLKQRLLEMASYSENAVRDAVAAVIERNLDLAISVRNRDSVIDRFEVELDETAIRLLAMAPLASDLRLVTVATKISQNLERIGDEASKISNRARDLAQEPPLKLLVDIPRLAGLALNMLKEALDSFVNQDPVAARALIPRDREVDRLNKEIYATLVRHMMESGQNITRCLHVITVAKSLERIADHATNVAEEVVYLYEAQDIRHSGKGPVESAPTPPPST